MGAMEAIGLYEGCRIGSEEPVALVFKRFPSSKPAVAVQPFFTSYPLDIDTASAFYM